MRAGLRALLALCLGAAVFAQDAPLRTLWPTFQAVAGPRALDRAAQCLAESGRKDRRAGWVFNTRAVSYCGAEGLAQFMPTTWPSWGEGSPFDPLAAIKANHRYMNALERRFQVEAQGEDWKALALVGYNAGPGNASRALRLSRASGLGLVEREAWLAVYLPKITKQNAGQSQGYVRHWRGNRAALLLEGYQ